MERKDNVDGVTRKAKATPHCIFCLKCPRSKPEQRLSLQSGKWLQLLERYLDLKLPFKLNSNVCEDCVILMDSFCEMYDQMKLLEMRMDWVIWKLKCIMISANKVPSRVASVRQFYSDEYDGKMEMESGDFMEELQAGRRTLVKTCTSKLSTRYPKVRVMKLRAGKPSRVDRAKTKIFPVKPKGTTREMGQRRCANCGAKQVFNNLGDDGSLEVTDSKLVKQETTEKMDVDKEIEIEIFEESEVHSVLAENGIDIPIPTYYEEVDSTEWMQSLNSNAGIDCEGTNTSNELEPVLFDVMLSSVIGKTEVSQNDLHGEPSLDDDDVPSSTVPKVGVHMRDSLPSEIDTTTREHYAIDPVLTSGSDKLTSSTHALDSYSLEPSKENTVELEQCQIRYSSPVASSMIQASFNDLTLSNVPCTEPHSVLNNGCEEHTEVNGIDLIEQASDLILKTTDNDSVLLYEDNQIEILEEVVINAVVTEKDLRIPVQHADLTELPYSETSSDSSKMVVPSSAYPQE